MKNLPDRDQTRRTLIADPSNILYYPRKTLVPAEVDLRNYDCFNLNVVRLMASEIRALSTGDEFKVAVRLWCVAWQQVPAGGFTRRRA